MAADSKPVTPKDKLDKFLDQSTTKQQSMVLEAPPVIRELIDHYLESFNQGNTTKTVQEFHRYLHAEYKIKFSCDTLKRYCKKFKPKLWKRYTEVRNDKV